MTFDFRDSFDLYASINDPLAGWWDGSVNTSSMTLVSGRFSGGQSLSFASSATGGWYKNSGSNDAVHHVIVAFQQTAGISGSTNGCYLTLGDGSTAQCSIVFRSDGAILFTSGASNGTVLATYSGAFVSSSVWYAFEFEVVINNSTGSFTARANGATSNSFQATGLNTRGGTANNYATRLTIGMQSSISTQKLDDLIWRSDASSVSWLGDQRCYTLMPASDGTVQFSRSPSPTTVTPFTTISGSSATANGTARYGIFTATYDGTIGTVTVSMATGYTGNMKCSIFAALSSQQPGSVAGSATAIVNPVTGTNTFTFGSPVSVTHNVQYFVGFDFDSASGAINRSSASTGIISTTAYASFPVASPTITVDLAPIFSAIITPTTNYQMTAEAQQDGITSFVYDSTVGHGDLYNISALPTSLVPPSSISAVVTRGFMAKSDAGARSGQVQLQSSATNVTSTALTLATSFQWNGRTDLVDPATSSAWTVNGVNAIQIGPVVQA